jgi:hypothetical protein
MEPREKDVCLVPPPAERTGRFQIERLEERIAPCSDASGPPGLCGSGPPGTAPGNSNPPGGK